MLAISAAALGYCKLTLLNGYHFEAYLSSPRARRLYWGARLSAITLALSLAALGYAAKFALFSLPLYLLAAFAVYTNVRATRMRLSGRYRDFYGERGMT
jgi:hypothetical protein